MSGWFGDYYAQQQQQQQQQQQSQQPQHSTTNSSQQYSNYSLYPQPTPYVQAGYGTYSPWGDQHNLNTSQQYAQPTSVSTNWSSQSYAQQQQPQQQHYPNYASNYATTGATGTSGNYTTVAQGYPASAGATTHQANPDSYGYTYATPATNAHVCG